MLFVLIQDLRAIITQHSFLALGVNVGGWKL